MTHSPLQPEDPPDPVEALLATPLLELDPPPLELDPPPLEPDPPPQPVAAIARTAIAHAPASSLIAGFFP